MQGRPLRVRNNPYIQNWEQNRASEIKELTGRGKIPVEHDIESMGDDIDDEYVPLFFIRGIKFVSGYPQNVPSKTLALACIHYDTAR